MLLALSVSLLLLACERCISERSDAAVDPLACERCMSDVPVAACDPLDCAAALDEGVAVVDWLVDALPALPDDALGLEVDPVELDAVSPEAELPRLLLVFVDAWPDDALCDGVLCDCVLCVEAAESLPGVDVPLDCA